MFDCLRGFEDSAPATQGYATLPGYFMPVGRSIPQRLFRLDQSITNRDESVAILGSLRIVRHHHD